MEQEQKDNVLCPPELRTDTAAQKREVSARIRAATLIWEMEHGPVPRLASGQVSAPGPLPAGAAEVRVMISGSREVEGPATGIMGGEE